MLADYASLKHVVILRQTRTSGIRSTFSHCFSVSHCLLLATCRTCGVVCTGGACEGALDCSALTGGIFSCENMNCTLISASGSGGAAVPVTAPAAAPVPAPVASPMAPAPSPVAIVIVQPPVAAPVAPTVAQPAAGPVEVVVVAPQGAAAPSGVLGTAIGTVQSTAAQLGQTVAAALFMAIVGSAIAL